MHILVAPNAFKHSCSASEAAAAIARGLQQSRLSCSVEQFPVADGGDGTGELLVNILNGKMMEARVHDPLGRMISSRFGLIDEGKTAVIEMADASGIRLLKREELDPLRARSTGTGELILHALDFGVTEIILCIGGSATVDGATGILEVLGVRFINEEGKLLHRLPEQLSELHRIDTTSLDKRVLQTSITILCDVDNKLLGKDGAATVFGPQKGANEMTVIKLDACLKRWSEVVRAQTGKDMAEVKHGGAAGGVAAGLYATLNAMLVNGIDYFLDKTNFSKALQEADIVITGEGSIDEQTLQGKGPFGVAVQSKKNAKSVIGLSGRLPVKPDPRLYEYFDVLLSITHSPVQFQTAMHDTLPNLERTAKEIGNMIFITRR